MITLPSTLQRTIPNGLTVLRIVLAGAFFIVLGLYRFPDETRWALPAAVALFVIAALTDALDGYLARKWNAVSVFGRIMDPFADKVLILGAFIILASPIFHPFYNPLVVAGSISELLDQQPGTFALGFTETEIRSGDLFRFELGIPVFFLESISGVAPWMAIVILARELLVTSIRGAFEARGVDFSASGAGKLKMIAQSLGVPLILASTWILIGDPFSELRDAYPDGLVDADPTVMEGVKERVMLGLNINRITALSVTILTALSAVPYLIRAVKGARGTSV